MLKRIIDRTDPGYWKFAQTKRDEFQKDVEAGKIRIENGWVVELVGYCTCAGGTVESNGMHENHCGMVPLQDLFHDAVFEVDDEVDPGNGV